MSQYQFEMPDQIEDEPPSQYEVDKYGSRSQIGYNRSAFMEICVRIAEGESLNSMLGNGPDCSHLPAMSSFFRWIDAHPGLWERYLRAIQLRGLGYSEEIVGIADQADKDGAAVARLRVEARKWVVSKMWPKLFGDQVEHIHSGTVEVGAATLSQLAEEGAKQAQLQLKEQERLMEEDVVEAEVEELEG